jgi:hypothetical protein
MIPHSYESTSWGYMKRFVAALGFGNSEFVLVSHLSLEPLLWVLVRPEWDGSPARAFWLKAALTERRFRHHPHLIKHIDQLSPTAVLAVLKYLSVVPYPDLDYKWVARMVSLFSSDDRTLLSRLNERCEHRKRFPSAQLEFASSFLTALDAAVEEHFGGYARDLSQFAMQLALSSAAIPAGWFLGARGAIVEAVLTAECCGFVQ